MAFNSQKTKTNFTAAEPNSAELPSNPEPSKPENQSHEPYKTDERLKRKLRRRSGGPSTEKGKAKASQNSIKHGAYAAAPKPTDEYCHFESQVYGHLKPMGFMQEELVARISYAMWRSKQIQQYTMESVGWAELDEVQLERLASLLEFPFKAKFRPILNSPLNELELQRRLALFWRDALDGVGVSKVADIVAADERIKKIHKEGIKILDQKVMIQFNHENFFLAMDRVMIDARTASSSLGLKLTQTGALEPLVDYWVFRNSSRISIMRRRILVSNALQILCDPNIERAQNMADRSLNNLLQSFWLMKNTDMTSGRDINPTVPKQTASHLSVKQLR
jgi:hypothetical protein